MRIAIIVGLSVACCTAAARAQVPQIIGTWKFNAAESDLPGGPPPQTHVRRYELAKDGTSLICLTVVVDADGNPHFLQFAAKPDGKDYAQFDSDALAQFQIDGAKPRGTYAETPVDSHTVEWVTKVEGRVTSRGKRQISADGNKLSFSMERTNDNGGTVVAYAFVLDRVNR